MNKVTLAVILVLFLASTPLSVFTQEKKQPAEDLTSVENYREQIRRLVGFLEFSLNTLGGSEASTREKEVIINESYLKAFLNDKVQIEDDLDENREILTYKDIQAYLKDVDFFFKEAAFQFDVQDIQSLKNDQGMPYFKVTANRNLQAVTLDDQPVNNNKTRYIEVNLDENEQVLKIASIYTTRLNEAQELMTWWNGMPQEWKDFLGSGYSVSDSVTLNSIDFLNDTVLLAVSLVPEIRQSESYVRIGADSLLIMKTDTVMTEIYDTIAAGRNNGLRFLKEITRKEILNISENRQIKDLYPVDQLSDLKTLNISQTNISDLFSARNLNKLVSLNISGTSISDLSPIRYNNRIREFYLDSTLVSDLSPVQGFKSLKVLHLNYSLVDNLDPVRHLDSLLDLRFDHTAVNDLTPLGDLIFLENLSLNETEVSSLLPVEYLITLEKIYFESTRVNDFTPLSKLSNLQIIVADKTGVTDLEPLSGLESLQKVYCDQTGVTRSTANAFMVRYPGILVIYESEALSTWWEALDADWQKVFRSYTLMDPAPTTEQLHQLTLISSIDISGNKNITTIAPLAKLTNLKEINASGTLIADIDAVSELSELSILLAAGTRVSSLAVLDNLIKLEQLDFSNTLLDSLSGLESLSHLQVLKIEGTGVENLDLLIQCHDLQFVYCDNTKVGKADIDRFLDQNPDCLVVYQSGLLKNWWNNLDQAWHTAFRAHAQLDATPTREQLHTLAGLPALDLTGNREITSLQPLVTLHRLEDLNLSNGVMKDIAPLSNLVRLRKLNLSGNPVENLVPVGSLPLLTYLDISNTPVLKLDDIAGLKQLEYLNCSGTQIKKLDPVEGLVRLTKLECHNTGINSLKPLASLVQLKQLVCYNTKLNDKKVAAFREMSPGTEVVFY